MNIQRGFAVASALWLFASVHVLNAQGAVGKPGYALKENIWDKRVFEILANPKADNKTATWLYFDPATRRGMPGPPKNAEEVLALYDKQNVKSKAKGIFVYSCYFAVKSFDYTPYQMMQSKDKDWLASEAQLIDDLRQACEKRGLALYVNTHQDRTKAWIVLVASKN